MRRSASDIINDLEMRIARLEKSASHNSVYTVELSEVNAINQLGKKMKSEDLELVLLNALSNNLKSHREALQLSKGLGLTSNNSWLGNRRIAQISNILVVNKVLSVEGLGKVLAQYCRDFAPQKERLVLKMLKTIGVSLREYSLNSLQDLFDLIYQTKVDLSDKYNFEVQSYKSIEYKEDDVDGGYESDDYGYRHAYGKGKGYLTLDIVGTPDIIKVHQDFHFIANLIAEFIDDDQIEGLKGHGFYPGYDWDSRGESWPDDGMWDFGIDSEADTLLNMSWLSGSFDSKGLLTFYVEFESAGRFEDDDDGFDYEPDDDGFDYEPW